MARSYQGICEDVKKDGVWLQTVSTPAGDFNTVSGTIWRGLKCREKHTKPAYKDTKILFEDFQSFCEWCRCQPGYGIGWHLDKDLLSDHPIYSEETCCLLPPDLNVMMQGIGSWKRGEMVGASYFKRDSCWRAYGNERRRQIHLGYFDTQKEAHSAWRLHKAGLLENYDKSALPEKTQLALEVLIQKLISF